MTDWLTLAFAVAAGVMLAPAMARVVLRLIREEA